MKRSLSLLLMVSLTCSISCALENSIQPAASIKKANSTSQSAKKSVKTGSSMPKGENYLLLSSTDPVARRNAVIYLGSEHKKENVQYIVKMLDDENVEVRRAAVNALGGSNDMNAPAVLLEKFKAEKNLNVKMTIIIALGDLKSKAAVPFMKGLLKDPYPAVRSEAIKALGKINSPETYSDIAAMLSDEAEGVRVMTAQVVAMLKISEAVPLLIKNLSDPIAVVRRSCAQSLGALADEGAIKYLENVVRDADKSVSSAAANSIDNIRRDIEAMKAKQQEKKDK